MSALGLPHSEVWLVPYDPEWPGLFAEEAIRIREACGPMLVDVVHVGSTAVVGLAAKPIIDLMLGVDRFDGAASLVPALESLGYLSLGEYGVPGRLFLRRGEPCTHHVQLTEVRSPFWEDEILFRDILRRDGDTAKAYELLKCRLAERHRHDRPAYTAAKSDFILATLAAARA